MTAWLLLLHKIHIFTLTPMVNNGPLPRYATPRCLSISNQFDLKCQGQIRKLQYIPRNMHTVFALLCFVVVIHWLIFPYPSGLLHWHCGNLMIAPVPAKQPWWIWINTSCEYIMNDCITTTKQSTTKPCAYFLGYTVMEFDDTHNTEWQFDLPTSPITKYETIFQIASTTNWAHLKITLVTLRQCIDTFLEIDINSAVYALGYRLFDTCASISCRTYNGVWVALHPSHAR